MNTFILSCSLDPDLFEKVINRQLVGNSRFVGTYKHYAGKELKFNIPPKKKHLFGCSPRSELVGI